jgi:hypothetical protein
MSLATIITSFGPFNSTSPSPIASIANLSASSISGKNYAIVVADTVDFLCVDVKEFTIECDDIILVDPCVGENNISLGPKPTSVVTNATSYDCDAVNPIYQSLGFHILTSVQVQPAAQGFTVEYFSPSGFNLTQAAGGVLGYSAGMTMIQAPGHDFLIPGSGYTVVITDNLGCSTTETFTIKCDALVPADPTYDCNNGCNVSALPISTVAPFTIFGSHAACIASDCHNNQCTGVPWVGCCDYVQNTGQGYPPSPSVGDSGPNIDPVTGFGKSCYEDPCCDCCGVPPLYPIPNPTNQDYTHPACQGPNWDNSGPICIEPNLSCFVAGTKVIMADGTSKNIEDVKIGDEILAQNGINKVIDYDRPLLGDRKLYSFNNGKPFVTSEHPFMTIDGWKSINPIATFEENPDLNVETLNITDVILTQFDPITIENIDIHDGNADQLLYNFILDGDHTYYADGYLVHNKA